MEQIKLINIDYIMGLLDWNKSIAYQAEGIKMAENIENINVFLQPCSKNYNKNVWDNCAKILSARSNEELSPYMIELMEWLQDMNWPGAFCIFERLKGMVNEQLFQHSYTICLKYAQALEDEVWENNLRMLKAGN